MDVVLVGPHLPSTAASPGARREELDSQHPRNPKPTMTPGVSAHRAAWCACGAGRQTPGVPRQRGSPHRPCRTAAEPSDGAWEHPGPR